LPMGEAVQFRFEEVVGEDVGLEGEEVGFIHNRGGFCCKDTIKTRNEIESLVNFNYL
jgi:hypothetical protein